MLASRIAADARCFAYVPAAKFFCEQAKRRKRTLIDGWVVHTIRAIRGGFERIKVRR